MTDIASAIKAIDPDADVCVVGDDLNQITWFHGTPPIPDEVILAKQVELIAAYPLQELRRERNQLLASSDWTGLADSALTNEVAAQWKLYRQKLRDLPKGLTTPAKVKAATWPAMP